MSDRQNSPFLKLLSSGKPVLSDGAMGTVLHARGVSQEENFDRLNITNPALVAEVHREYIDAGAHIIQTNTFGSNRFKLTRAGLGDQVAEINKAGVDLARRVVLASFKPVLIAGDIGPLGVRMAPFGRIQPEQARAAFREQIAALVEAGVDLLIIETMTDLYEAREAIAAAREVTPETPVVVSMTYTRDDRTVLGNSPAAVARFLAAEGADCIGVNCSGGPNQILRILRQMRQAAPEARFSAMPNAGWPEQISGRIMYAAAPDYFGDTALSLSDAGASLIGGCCGTTPAHIAAMSKALSTFDGPRITITLAHTEAEHAVLEEQEETTSRLMQRLREGKFAIAVEMDPPRGLSTHKVLAGASLLSEAGADVINVADSPMARMRMSPWAVCDLLQRKVGIETVLHFPTRGRNLLRVQGDLLAAHAIGVRNVFVVMGDPTSIGDYPDANDNYDLVPSGLIKLIKQGFNAGMDHSGSDIGQPTNFVVGGALNLSSPKPEDEIKNLRRKLRAGVDFLLTQPIYDPAPAGEFLARIRQEIENFNTPILMGILPLASARHAAFLHHEVPGITIPEVTLERMQAAGDQGAREGVRIAVELVEQIRPMAQGVYLMPAFNRFDLSAEIIDAVRKAPETN